MSINEQSLRELLASKHADFCAQAVIDRVATGGQFTILTIDGSALVLTTVEEARIVLIERFGCTPP
jgi:hypothetical protein